MKNAAQIFGFLCQAAANGERSALITITMIYGGSPREVGTHMAVSETGAYIGSISGGCVEAAIVGEAKRVIASGRAEQLRLGEGSPFIDIRLPCGGGMDILISPSPAVASLREACAGLANRQSVVLMIAEDGALATRVAQPDDDSSWHADVFHARHDPDMHLIIAGHSEEVLALCRIGLAYNARVTVLSPHEGTVKAATAFGAEAWPLRANQRSPHLVTDPHTAVVLLFHDHDLETEVLMQALEQPAFFIGAMGSKNTQARRLEVLAQRGVAKPALARLVGPIGLIGTARDPDTLALSAMAQLVSRYHESGRHRAPQLTAMSV